MRAIKTHCKNGHPLIPDNLLWRTNRGKPQRRCKACYLNYQEALKRTANFERPNVATGPYNPHPMGIAVKAPGWGWTPMPAKAMRLKEAKNAWN